MKKNVHIEFIATDIDNLAMMGFGSIENCRSVYNVLKKNYTHVNFNIIRNKEDLDKIISKKPDLVFSGIKYLVFDNDCKNKIWVSEFMAHFNVNFVGSTKSAIELEYNKSSAKKIISNFAINTAPYFVSRPGLFKERLPLPFPLFVKPLHEGDGTGIDSNSVVYDFKSYERKVEDIYKSLRQSSLVERYIEGREFTVSIIKLSDGNYKIMPIEIIIRDKNPLNKILGYKTKSENNEIVVKIDDIKILKSVTEIAKKSFIALGARDYGRIDIIMDKENKPYFMEANLVPGMTRRLKENDSSYFPRACYINKNMTYHNTIIEITEIALKRKSMIKNVV
jgi:D-alanine-D-alanine ligase